jgi:uncharacterized protein (DUF4415 family)
MTKSGSSKRLNLAEVKAKLAKGESKTRSNAPEADDLPNAFWAESIRVVRRPAKASVHLRIDAEVLAWFKLQGTGHLTLMNDVLKAYATSKKNRVG